MTRLILIPPTDYGLRGVDGYGSGAFGAPRDDHDHRGVDLRVRLSEHARAPMTGTVRLGYPYEEDLSYRYVAILSDDRAVEVRVYYVDPIHRTGQRVHLGDPIGEPQTLQPLYPGITDHVHLEVRLSPVVTIGADDWMPVDPGLLVDL